MILSPKSLLPLISKGKLITNLAERELLIPEGVGFDLTLSKLSCLKGVGGKLGVQSRRTPTHEIIEPDNELVYTLNPNQSYLATTCEEFDLPNEMAAIFSPRSTLFRSGIVFQSSVLPTGYIGAMTFLLTNQTELSFEIEEKARFAHVIFLEVSGEVNQYQGQWQGGRISQPTDEKQI